MQEKKHSYLPIGSIIQLEVDNPKMVMITGLRQKQVDTGKIWDYSACYYPEGIINPKNLFLFNSEQIVSIKSIGYQDNEWYNLNDRLLEPIN